MDLLDPSCIVSTDRKSWWMRYREGAEVRGREDSGMTIRFLERRTNYFVVIFLGERPFEGILLGSFQLILLGHQF